MKEILKKIILTIGLIAIFIVILTNLLYTGEMDRNEIVTIKQNSLILVVSAILIGIALYIICKVLKNKQLRTNVKETLFEIFIIIYVCVQVIYNIEKQNVVPYADQAISYSLATSMQYGQEKEFINNSFIYGNVSGKIYFERCQQQLTLACVWKTLFSLFRTNNLNLIRIFNVIGNILTLISIVLICKELSKKYKINEFLAIILICTFTSLIYLITFIYGDLLGLGFSMLGVYFIMKYVSEKKIRYAIASSILMSIAYMLRMNYLIFVIAILIYLFLDLIDKNNYSNNLIEHNENKIDYKTKTNKLIIKNIITKTLVIVCFSAIIFMPSNIIKTYYCNKMDLDKGKGFPITGYLYMGMSESQYGNGQYLFDYAKYTYDDYEKSKIQYKDGIKERINYFVNNPKYFFKFYNKKISSMWVENTYSAFVNNQMYDNVKETKIVALYQKALIFIIFGCTLVVLIQNRKNLSNEVILLLTIFIGGFLFHVLWEAKSRYIIPYIVVLIPIASIEINKILKKK